MREKLLSASPGASGCPYRAEPAPLSSGVFPRSLLERFRWREDARPEMALPLHSRTAWLAWMNFFFTFLFYGRDSFQGFTGLPYWNFKIMTIITKNISFLYACLWLLEISFWMTKNMKHFNELKIIMKNLHFLSGRPGDREIGLLMKSLCIDALFTALWTLWKPWKPFLGINKEKDISYIFGCSLLTDRRNDDFPNHLLLRETPLLLWMQQKRMEREEDGGSGG